VQARDWAAADLEARFGGVIDAPEACRRLAREGARLIHANPELPRDCQYLVLDEASCNAFSLPGRIYVTRGLYARLERSHHLAAALAHEFAHLVRGDSLKPRCATDAESLDREMDADRLAMRYLCRAGYHDTSLGELIELVRDEQPLSWVERRGLALGEPCDPAWTQSPRAEPAGH